MVHNLRQTVKRLSSAVNYSSKRKRSVRVLGTFGNTLAALGDVFVRILAGQAGALDPPVGGLGLLRCDCVRPLTSVAVSDVPRAPLCPQTKAAYVLFYMRREPQSAACRLPLPPRPATVVSNGRASDSEDSEADEMDCS